MSKIDELFNLIDNAQKGNKESMQKLFVMFTPLLKKIQQPNYQRGRIFGINPQFFCNA